MKVFNPDVDFLNYNYRYHLEEKENINSEVNFSKSKSIENNKRIALWKYDRIIVIADELLLKLSKVISCSTVRYDDLEVKEIIEELVDCDGVGYPLASSILKFINPDAFPIIAVRAYRALIGKKIYYSLYSYELYMKYTREIHGIRDFSGLKLSEVDEQLHV